MKGEKRAWDQFERHLERLDLESLAQRAAPQPIRKRCNTLPYASGTGDLFQGDHSPISWQKPLDEPDPRSDSEFNDALFGEQVELVRNKNQIELFFPNIFERLWASKKCQSHDDFFIATLEELRIIPELNTPISIDDLFFEGTEAQQAAQLDFLNAIIEQARRHKAYEAIKTVVKRGATCVNIFPIKSPHNYRNGFTFFVQKAIDDIIFSEKPLIKGTKIAQALSYFVDATSPFPTEVPLNYLKALINEELSVPCIYAAEIKEENASSEIIDTYIEHHPILQEAGEKTAEIFLEKIFEVSKEVETQTEITAEMALERIAFYYNLGLNDPHITALYNFLYRGPKGERVGNEEYLKLYFERKLELRQKAIQEALQKEVEEAAAIIAENSPPIISSKPLLVGLPSTYDSGNVQVARKGKVRERRSRIQRIVESGFKVAAMFAVTALASDSFYQKSQIGSTDSVEPSLTTYLQADTSPLSKAPQTQTIKKEQPPKSPLIMARAAIEGTAAEALINNLTNDRDLRNIFMGELKYIKDGGDVVKHLSSFAYRIASNKQGLREVQQSICVGLYAYYMEEFKDLDWREIDRVLNSGRLEDQSTRRKLEEAKKYLGAPTSWSRSINGKPYYEVYAGELNTLKQLIGAIRWMSDPNIPEDVSVLTYDAEGNLLQYLQKLLNVCQPADFLNHQQMAAAAENKGENQTLATNTLQGKLDQASQVPLASDKKLEVPTKKYSPPVKPLVPKAAPTATNSAPTASESSQPSAPAPVINDSIDGNQHNEGPFNLKSPQFFPQLDLDDLKNQLDWYQQKNPTKTVDNHQSAQSTLALLDTKYDLQNSTKKIVSYGPVSTAHLDGGWGDSEVEDGNINQVSETIHNELTVAVNDTMEIMETPEISVEFVELDIDLLELEEQDGDFQLAA